MLRQGPEHRFENRFQALALSAERHVEPASSGCDGFQRRFIEPGFYEHSRLVFHESAALIRRYWDEIAARGSDSYRVNRQAVQLLRRLGRHQSTTLEILAIGNQYQNSIAAGPPAQRRLRLVNRA